MGGTRSDFTIRQLDIFVQAARTGNFGRAAKLLGITQPAVSSCVVKLETRLGRRLFERRSGGTPVLTLDGRDLLAKAEALLSTSAAIRADDDQGGQRKRRVRLCIGPLLRDRYLKPMLPRLYRDHPEIEIELVPVIPHADVKAALDRGQVDLIVYTVGRAVEDWPNIRLIADIPTVMIGPAGIGARLASGAVDIADLPFILPATTNLSEHWIESELRRIGIELRQRIVYLDFPDVIQEMVAGGQGVSVLMHEQVAEGITQGRLEVFGPAFPSMQRLIARSGKASAVASIVEDYLAAAFERAQPMAEADAR